MSDFDFLKDYVIADKGDLKEAQGRVATKIMLRGSKHKFTPGKYAAFDGLSTGSTCTVLEEIKAYNDPEYPRTHDKFNNYQIDMLKCSVVTAAAKNNKDELGRFRRPLLMVFFTDRFMIWDLSKINWINTAKLILTNKEGTNYGEKEWSWQVYLEFQDVIYDKEIPPTLWQDVRTIIESYRPGIYDKIKS